MRSDRPAILCVLQSLAAGAAGKVKMPVGGQSQAPGSLLEAQRNPMVRGEKSR